MRGWLMLVMVAAGVAFAACSDDSGEEASNQAGGAGGGSGASGGGGGTGGSQLEAGAGAGGTSPEGGAGAAGAGSGASGAGGAGGSGGGTNCRTTCLGNECGFMSPDGCGGVLDCGDCGPGTDYCIVQTSTCATAVQNAVAEVVNANPAGYFNPDGTVADAASFRDSVVAGVIARGKVAIPDPNDNLEIRVRGPNDAAAENFRIVRSDLVPINKYTSTCTPAGF